MVASLRELANQELWERHWHDKRNWHEPSQEPLTELRKRFHDRLSPNDNESHNALHECFIALWLLPLGCNRTDGTLRGSEYAPTRRALRFFCDERKWLSRCVDGQPCEFVDDDVRACIESLANQSFERPLPSPPVPTAAEPNGDVDADALASRVRLACDILGAGKAKMWAASRHMIGDRGELTEDEIFDELVDMAKRDSFGFSLGTEFRRVSGHKRAIKKMKNAVQYSDFKFRKQVLNRHRPAIRKSLDPEEYEVLKLRFDEAKGNRPLSWKSVFARLGWRIRRKTNGLLEVQKPKAVQRESSRRRATLRQGRKPAGTGSVLCVEWDRYLRQQWAVRQDESGWSVRKRRGGRSDWPSVTPVGKAVMGNIWSKINDAIAPDIDNVCKRQGKLDCCIVLCEKLVERTRHGFGSTTSHIG